MIDAIQAAKMTRQMPHMMSVYYFRSAFDFHHQGMTKDEAQGAARRKCEGFPGVPLNVIFPPIPWDKYEFYYPATN